MRYVIDSDIISFRFYFVSCIPLPINISFLYVTCYEKNLISSQIQPLLWHFCTVRVPKSWKFYSFSYPLLHQGPCICWRFWNEFSFLLVAFFCSLSFRYCCFIVHDLLFVIFEKLRLLFEDEYFVIDRSSSSFRRESLALFFFDLAINFFRHCFLRFDCIYSFSFICSVFFSAILYFEFQQIPPLTLLPFLKVLVLI